MTKTPVLEIVGLIIWIAGVALSMSFDIPIAAVIAIALVVTILVVLGDAIRNWLRKKPCCGTDAKVSW